MLEVQPRVVVDVLKQPLSVVEVPLCQSVELRKPKLSKHQVLTIKAPSLFQKALADGLNRIYHAFVLRHLVQRLHDL